MGNINNIDDLLIISALRALDNKIPKSLISASIELKISRKKWMGIFNNNKTKEIQWLCIFDQTATETDFEFGSIAGTEIIADFSSEYRFTEMFKKIELNQKTRVLKNIVYSQNKEELE